jgi:hypothetical protein
MIAGPDLATATLEPHEFLDSLRRRLSRQFVADAPDLQLRLARLDLEPDPDGRYRVNEPFCHDDTWRPTVQALGPPQRLRPARSARLYRRRHGVTYEISQLVELVPLRRVLVLTDDSTDYNFLRTVLDTAWRRGGPASPNWTDCGAPYGCCRWHEEPTSMPPQWSISSARAVLKRLPFYRVIKGTSERGSSSIGAGTHDMRKPTL